MPTLKERLDAACEGRPVGALPSEVLAALEGEIAAIEAGDRRGLTLEEIEAKRRELEELEAQREKLEARSRDRQVPPHR